MALAHGSRAPRLTRATRKAGNIVYDPDSDAGTLDRRRRRDQGNALSSAARTASPAADDLAFSPDLGRPPDRRTVVILGSLVAFGPLAIDTYLPALPELSRELDASTTATQVTLTACLVGMAAGQLLAGPVSDAVGRRRPLLLGVAGFTAMSILCAFATTVWALIALRFVQGIGGGAGVVIARAVVRDRHAGIAAVRVFGLMMVVTGVAPILAPLVGAAVLGAASWRGIFVVLAAIGGLIFTSTYLGLRESLPHERRRRGGLGATVSTFGSLAKDRHFVACAFACALPFGAMFAYISGSPFVLQEVYGLSPTGFAVVFGVNALGIVGAAILGNRLVGRVGPGRLLMVALVAGCAGGVGLLLAVVADAGLPGVLPALFVMVSMVGLVLPNATGLGLERHPDVAGSASALLGVLPFVAGAVAAPLVGVSGAADALPLAIVVAVLETAALVQYAVLTRAVEGRP